jgi:DNA-binding NarL/FixJ family response regulator
MTTQIAVRIPDSTLEALDRAVARGDYATRTEAVRAALQQLEKNLRDKEIAEEYRQAYGQKPQDEWIGEFGLGLLAAAVAGEDFAGDPHSSTYRGPTGDLSEREYEVLTLLADGLDIRDIAGRLRLSEAAVAGHLADLYRKLRRDNIQSWRTGPDPFEHAVHEGALDRRDDAPKRRGRRA